VSVRGVLALIFKPSMSVFVADKGIIEEMPFSFERGVQSASFV
jgi:hypothetical protein